MIISVVKVTISMLIPLIHSYYRSRCVYTEITLEWVEQTHELMLLNWQTWKGPGFVG